MTADKFSYPVEYIVVLSTGNGDVRTVFKYMHKAIECWTAYITDGKLANIIVERA